MNTKILALAALTALSFGVGSAMAQSTVPASAYGASYGTQLVAPQATGQVVRSQDTTVQYGSSDHGFATPNYDTNLTAGGF
jgi:hypothetical protein